MQAGVYNEKSFFIPICGALAGVNFFMHGL